MDSLEKAADRDGLTQLSVVLGSTDATLFLGKQPAKGGDLPSISLGRQQSIVMSDICLENEFRHGSHSRARLAGARELTTGLLAKDASFRLIVTGKIGVKEIERLIQKLEIDKEI